MPVQYLGREDPLEEGMATHFSILAWRIPWTEEPGGLQSVGSQRVGYDSDLAHMHACNTMMGFCYKEYWSGSQTGTLLVFCCKKKILSKVFLLIEIIQ